MELPEEKTWICPNDDSDAIDNIVVGSDGALAGGVVGQATNWILYNEASTPIIVERVHESPLVDVGAGGLREEIMKSAVYPHGPVVLPGGMAVVHGYEGQLFTAREYKHDIDLLSLDNEYTNSFKKALPRTWSVGGGESSVMKYTNQKNGAVHVLGLPGRILMKHRMGMIHIKNEYGALCPENLGGGGVSNLIIANSTEPRENLDPECNFVQKGIINKAGCPIDLYFAPSTRDPNSTFNCELYSDHMGSVDAFLNSGHTSNLDSFESPLIHMRTYNSHSFVARTSHDQSFVARIDIEADRVHDCPDLKRSVANVEVAVSGMVMHPVAEITNSSNVTEGMQERYAAFDLTLKSIPSVSMMMPNGTLSHSFYAKR